jgi:hypothetical protein
MAYVWRHHSSRQTFASSSSFSDMYTKREMRSGWKKLTLLRPEPGPASSSADGGSLARLSCILSRQP